MSDCSECKLKGPDGQITGPLPVDIIEELVKQGEVTADFLYLCPQSGEWLPIRELPVLKRASFLPSELQDTPHMNARQYYISVPGGEPEGPYSEAELKLMTIQGKIGKKHLYCVEGMPEWHPVAELDALPKVAASTAPAQTGECVNSHYFECKLKGPDGHMMGPLPVDIIEELVKQGEITADFLYLCPQSGEWLSICELPVLKRASFLPSELQDTPHIKPSSHLGWGIVLTIIGILPLGIFAICKSLKVAEHYGAGRYAQARRASDSVRNICLLNVVLTIVLWVGYVSLKHRLGI